jgi:hypothetical protein
LALPLQALCININGMLALITFTTGDDNSNTHLGKHTVDADIVSDSRVDFYGSLQDAGSTGG